MDEARWDPDRYGYRGLRRRPALELLARVAVQVDAPRFVVDLGCGTGDVTSELAARWSDARVVGVDRSPEMLERARSSPSAIEWVEADVGSWVPERPPDVIFSNAALHWLPDHDALFPRLVESLAPDGILAVQMPLSFDQPSHRLLRETLADWNEPVPSRPTRPASFYDDLFAARGWSGDIWETEYRHALDGDDPVLEWMCATSMRPVLARLDESRKRAFLDDLGRRLRDAYPRRPDGTTVFPFRRLFIVVRR